MQIDLVITYVDGSNPEWQANYLKQSEESYPAYFKAHKDTLKYLLRSVDKNLSFINQIFLVVQNTSEVPDYVDTNKVQVVTHDEFIPAEYLPTFNSNTIETFLWNIDGLSEHFLYMNDDWLILNNLTENQFYSADDKALAWFAPRYFENGEPNGFEEILIRNAELIWGITKDRALEKGYTLDMNHTVRPYFKSLYKECYEKYWDKIMPTLTRFRSATNYNLYIVDAYQNKLNKGINSLTVTTSFLTNTSDNSTVEKVLSLKSDTLCTHDLSESPDLWENELFLNFLKNSFAEVSKYEREVE